MKLVDDHNRPVAEEIKQVVRTVLADRLGSMGLREVEVQAGHDHDGDEVLLVDGYFDFTDKALDPTCFYALTTVLREVLEQHGESRFPHIRYHFHERQKVAGWQ